MVVLYKKYIIYKLLLQEFNLDLVDKIDNTFGIYNGHDFIFKSSNWKYWDYLKFFWKYGLNSPRKAKQLVEFIIKNILLNRI